MFCHHWSDEKWKNSMTGGGGQRKIFQFYSDSSGTLLYLRALQGHSGRNLIDPSLQDTVIIPDGFSKYIHHVGWVTNSHSIINSVLTPRGQILSKRQTSFFLSVNLMSKEHKDPETIRSGNTASCTLYAGSVEKNIRTLCIETTTSELLKRKD